MVREPGSLSVYLKELQLYTKKKLPFNWRQNMVGIILQQE